MPLSSADEDQSVRVPWLIQCSLFVERHHLKGTLFHPLHYSPAGLGR